MRFFIALLLLPSLAWATEEKTITCTFTQECARHMSCKSIAEFTYIMRGFTGENWLVELPSGERLEVEMRGNPAQYLRDHEIVAWAEPHADGTPHDTVMMLADDLKAVLTDMTKSEGGKFTVDSPRFLGTCEVRGE